MTLRLDGNAATLPEVERTVAGLGYKLARLEADWTLWLKQPYVCRSADVHVLISTLTYLKT
jgi:hypothetical protein